MIHDLGMKKREIMPVYDGAAVLLAFKLLDVPCSIFRKAISTAFIDGEAAAQHAEPVVCDASHGTRHAASHSMTRMMVQ